MDKLQQAIDEIKSLDEDALQTAKRHEPISQATCVYKWSIYKHAAYKDAIRILEALQEASE